MAEENQVQQVTTKDPKKVKAGTRLSEHNHRKREEHAQLAKTQSESNITYYGAGVVVAIGVLGVIGYYVYQSKTPKETPVHQSKEAQAQRPKETPANKFLMDKMDKKSVVNDLYQAVVISVFAIGYSVLGKKILNVAPPSIQKFDLEDTRKLVAIVAASEMMREYLIKQKILPEHIDV